jgi:hypothetical protein
MTKDLSRDIAIIEGVLSDVRDALVGRPPSPTLRAWRAKLEAYRRLVLDWHDSAPSEEQCADLLESVMELHEEVFGDGTDRPTRPAPDGDLLPAGAVPSDAPRPTSKQPTKRPSKASTKRPSKTATKPPKGDGD